MEVIVINWLAIMYIDFSSVVPNNYGGSLYGVRFFCCFSIPLKSSRSRENTGLVRKHKTNAVVLWPWKILIIHAFHAMNYLVSEFLNTHCKPRRSIHKLLEVLNKRMDTIIEKNAFSTNPNSQKTRFQSLWWKMAGIKNDRNTNEIEECLALCLFFMCILATTY